MSAGPFIVYQQAVLALTRDGMNLSADAFNMVLLTSAYLPSPTDGQYASVSPFEVADGSGYTTGGMPLFGVSANLTLSVIPFVCAPVTWPSFNRSFQFAVIIRNQAAAPTLSPNDLLLCYCDCTGGGQIVGNAGQLTIVPDASGVFVITP